MNCDQVKELLGRYQSGETEFVMTVEMGEHLKTCSACSREVSLLRKVVENLPAVSQLPESYWESYTQKILGRIEQNEKGQSFFLWRWVPALALPLIFISGISYIKIQERNKTEEIVANLELLEHLDLLDRADFEQMVSHEKK